jgi:hypothetical protein
LSDFSVSCVHFCNSFRLIILNTVYAILWYLSILKSTSLVNFKVI